MSDLIPSTDVIRHWCAWGVTDNCPDEYMQHDAERLNEFERWFNAQMADVWDAATYNAIKQVFVPNPYRGNK